MRSGLFGIRYNMLHSAQLFTRRKDLSPKAKAKKLVCKDKCSSVKHIGYSFRLMIHFTTSEIKCQDFFQNNFYLTVTANNGIIDT